MTTAAPTPPSTISKVATTILIITATPIIATFLGANFAAIALYQLWKD